MMDREFITMNIKKNTANTADSHGSLENVLFY